MRRIVYDPTWTQFGLNHVW